MSKPKKSGKFIYSLETLKKVRDLKEKQEQEELTKAEKKEKKNAFKFRMTIICTLKN